MRCVRAAVAMGTTRAEVVVVQSSAAAGDIAVVVVVVVGVRVRVFAYTAIAAAAGAHVRLADGQVVRVFTAPRCPTGAARRSPAEPPRRRESRRRCASAPARRHPVRVRVSKRWSVRRPP